MDILLISAIAWRGSIGTGVESDVDGDVSPSKLGVESVQAVGGEESVLDNTNENTNDSEMDAKAKVIELDLIFRLVPKHSHRSTDYNMVKTGELQVGEQVIPQGWVSDLNRINILLFRSCCFNFAVLHSDSWLV